MSQKRIIIIPNKDIYTLNNHVVSCENTHGETLLEYIIELGLPILDSNRNDGQSLACHLAELNFCVMLYDKAEQIENLIIYLPYQISTNQFEYINKRKTGLANFELSFVALNKDHSLTNYDKEITSVPIIEELMRVVTERYDNTNLSKGSKPKVSR